MHPSSGRIATQVRPSEALNHGSALQGRARQGALHSAAPETRVPHRVTAHAFSLAEGSARWTDCPASRPERGPKR